MDINSLIGKVFVSESGDLYGNIRKLGDTLPDALKIGDAEPFAEDECGNLFLLKQDAVWFWDHETGDKELLAPSVQDFKSGCIEEPQIELDPNQVVSVWIDPEFAKEIGIEVPKDGWKKSP